MPYQANTSSPSWTGNILPNLYSHWYGGGQPAAPASPTGQGSLQGDVAFNYDPSFGGIPRVPSPAGTQGAAIGGNIGNLGQLYNLGGSLNQFTAQQAPTSLNLNLPNYQASNQVLGGNILSKLKGQVPQDVLNQIGQFGAERGVATGSIGSPNSNAAMLRALGLTSLDLQNQGAQQFSQAIAQTPQGQQFNPFGFLVTPQQQQEAQYLANLLNAAPVPSSAQYAGLNALQAGRQSAYSPVPSSAPTASSVSPVSSYRGFGAGGVPNPPTTGGTAYASSIQEQTGLPNLPSWTNPNQFQFDTGIPSGTPSDWQTGLPLPGYGGPQWGGGPFPTEPTYQPFTVPGDLSPFPIGGDVSLNQSTPFDFSQNIDWSNLFGDAGG